jgi:hypothetical protein
MNGHAAGAASAEAVAKMQAVFPDGLSSLAEADPEVYGIIEDEKRRQWCAPPRAAAAAARRRRRAAGRPRQAQFSGPKIPPASAITHPRSSATALSSPLPLRAGAASS